ncbi:MULTISPECIES: ABC transporter permease [Nocardiopsis]|uniref:ABC transporter n=1 Tax=Nocardiopsis sinuspersici TaxID=501010 RepID=A0A1V3C6D8_9ACTN|nr:MULTISPECIES: ABC transporter permease [Nocardiopsis]OOC55950.1 ABC transporter [Nocardiopsis sinuspersici]
MNARANAVRAGFSRGWTEFRGSFTNFQELAGGYLMMPAIFVVLAVFLGREPVEGADVSTGTVMMAAGVTMQLVMLGVVTVAQVLGTEREDGTLLRARATPHGMLGYGVGKVWHILTMSTVALLLMVVPGLLLVDGFSLRGVGGTLTLLWVFVLAMLALAPVGAILGATLTNPRTGVGLIMVPVLGLVMTSGVMMPVTVMADWIQTAVRFFPVYWIGLGVRAALMPADYAALELTGTWQLPQVAGVLALWALVGFAVAQWVLRRMARRESGSRVQAAREKAMKRGY